MTRHNGHLVEMSRNNGVKISGPGTEPKILYYVLLAILIVILIQCFLYHEPSVQNRSAALLENDFSRLYSEIYHHRIRRILQKAMTNSSSSEKSNSSYRLCGEVPDLLGEMDIKEEVFKNKTSTCESCNKTLEDVIRNHPDIKPGGSWTPRDCIARHQVAFIIPYRDRYSNLVGLLDSLLPILKRQNIHFQIYLVEQNGSLTFNKGVLMNSGYIEALKEREWHCFTFHDVDLIPSDDRNMYTCPPQPRHMSVRIDKMQYRLPYEKLVGGVFILRTEHYREVNGYSNLYWGWGAEDDDMYERLHASGLRVERPSSNVSKYHMESHSQRASSPWKIRYGLLHTSLRRFRSDGVNSVKYKLLAKTIEPLFTRLLIDVGTPPDDIKFV